MDGILRRGFQLGDRRIYPLTGEIRSPDKTFRVPPIAMDVLLCLAEQQGRVLERAQIKQEVWGDVEVSDDQLARHVSLLRHHLGDDSHNPKFIRTITRHGYQLIMPIHAAGAPDAPDAPNPVEVNRTADRSWLATVADNIQRRRVIRVVGTYAIVVWVGLQVAATVGPPIGMPNWVMAVAVWVAALGFPLVAFLAWTFQLTDKGLVAHNSITSVGESIRSSRGRVLDFAVIAVLSLIIVYFVYERFVDSGTPLVIVSAEGDTVLPTLTPNVIQANSLAVLPFANLGKDARVDNLAMGLAEEVHDLLAQIHELRVPSKGVTFDLASKDVGLETIGQNLRVHNVLDGSLDGEVGDLEIFARLRKTDSGSHVWSESFLRSDMDLLAIRNDISRAVVGSLRLALSVESQNRLLQPPTNSNDAYDYYLQALGYLRRPRTAQTLDNAEALFRRALDLDPEYALAHAGLCKTYLGKYRLDRQTIHVEPAKRSCDAALSLDANLAGVHVALGSLFRHTGRYELAELEFHRAIALNPRIEPAFYGLGRVYSAQDKLKEAEGIFHYAVDLEPGYWGTHLALGNFYLNFGRPAEAIEPFTRVTELNPDYAMGFNNLGAAYYNSGDVENSEKAYLRSVAIEPSEFALSNIGTMYYNTGRFELAADMFGRAINVTPHDFRLWGRLGFAKRFIPGLESEAQQAFQTAIQLGEDSLVINPNDAKTLAYVAAYYANVGETDKANAAIDRAIDMAPNDPHTYYFAAHVSIAHGDSSEALDSLEKSLALGYAQDAIANDPVFADLRSNDRFQAFLK